MNISRRKVVQERKLQRSTLCPPHSEGELAKRWKEKEAQNNQGRSIRFRIMEKGGITLEQKLTRSNP